MSKHCWEEIFKFESLTEKILNFAIIKSKLFLFNAKILVFQSMVGATNTYIIHEWKIKLDTETETCLFIF